MSARSSTLNLVFYAIGLFVGVLVTRYVLMVRAQECATSACPAGVPEYLSGRCVCVVQPVTHVGEP